MLQVTINGQSHQFPEGLTINEALRQLDLEVPTLCHDDRIDPYGSCRLCTVEVKGMNALATACNTQIREGMEVLTHSPAVEGVRKTLLGLLAKDYPAEAVAEFPQKQFHRYLNQYGVKAGGSRNAPQPAVPFMKDASHPYINVDMSQCVTCYRCVRICEEVQGQFVWKAWNRGEETRIGPVRGETLLDGGCVSCGACVDTCPSGALEDITVLARGTPTEWTKTICSYCGTGCEVEVGTRGGKITTIRPSDGPSNHGHTCVKGRYAFDYVYAEERITSPMIRRDGQWQDVGWDEVIKYIADRFAAIAASHGPDSIGVLSSARGTNEENFVAQKFARAVLGTNNIDCCARVCHSPTAAAMKMTLGTGAATNSLDEIEIAKTIIVCGANPTDGHPVTGARIKQAARHGANLIIVDPREIELTEFATLHLQLRAGTNVILFNAMGATIVEEGLVDEEFLRTRITEFAEYRDFIREFLPEKVEHICNVPAAKIRAAARLYATAKPSLSVHGLGMTEHIQGTEGIMALVNLALLTGNIGKPGTGINPLRGQNNVQGAPHMGCEPKLLAGYVPIEKGRAQVEALWGTPIPTHPGLNMIDMLQAATEGRFKALWAIGYDILMTNPNAHETRRALEQVDLVIVQDLFLNATAREFGDVFLPAASSFEKDGTFMNGERRIQRVRGAAKPQGLARSDWEIICDVAKAMGKGEQFAYRSAEEIWDEVRSLWSEGAGISYARLDKLGGLQWPCLDENDPGMAIMHVDEFTHGKTTALRRIEFLPPPELTSPEFPFLLTTGRNLYQYNAATQTGQTPNNRLCVTDLLQISPVDAARLGLADGEPVRLASRQGEVELPVTISDHVKPGEVYTTFHNARVFLNQITTSQRDRYTQTPEYKITAVSIGKLAAAPAAGR
ncbi:MAG: formate dehydrogenase subunit alpha [Opitutaceae bacterium]|nr:formate dehydrogenase subunit alpha [Opitutaceae bacterium]MBP9912587.1 formate dehydrogenase subunit alpha [Opitutaceae bacterium]